MTFSIFDLEQNCDLVTQQPDRRVGPMRLGTATRCVVEHRPLPKLVFIELQNGFVLDETMIIALYEAMNGSFVRADSFDTPQGEKEAAQPKLRLIS